MLNYNELGLMNEVEMNEAVQFSVSTEAEVMDVTAAVWIKVALAIGGAVGAAL
jgi:hypothetical protein